MCCEQIKFICIWNCRISMCCFHQLYQLFQGVDGHSCALCGEYWTLRSSGARPRLYTTGCIGRNFCPSSMNQTLGTEVTFWCFLLHVYRVKDFHTCATFLSMAGVPLPAIYGTRGFCWLLSVLARSLLSKDFGLECILERKRTPTILRIWKR